MAKELRWRVFVLEDIAIAIGREIIRATMDGKSQDYIKGLSKALEIVNEKRQFKGVWPYRWR